MSVLQRCLNENILTRLTHASAKSLRRMELDFYADESVGNQAIGSNCWRAVAERCPSLAVVVRIHGLCGFQKYTSVLVRGIPLNEVNDGNGMAGLHRVLIGCFYRLFYTSLSLGMHEFCSV